MSELTPCNFCTLRRMRQRAKARGVRIIVETSKEPDLPGWTTARYSDEDKPSAYFMELTTRCAC